MSSNNHIIYFSYPGRLIRYKNQTNYSLDFFYSFSEISNSNKKQIVEVDLVQNPFQKIMKFYDKVIFKLTRIQTNSEKFCKISYQKIFLSNKTIVFTNFALATSAIPYIFFLKIFRKRKIFVINSGLFAFRKTNNLQKVVRNLYLNFLFLNISKLVFTSKTEYEFAIKYYKNRIEKFELIEFCPDYEFWKSNNDLPSEKRKGILFIGNDDSRDFSLLEPLAKELKEYNFTFISKNKIITDINLPNVQVISGKWHSKDLTDVDIKNYYLNSKLTILPTKNNLVSSGQSVSMQSMSCKTPVMISRSDGFWNKEKFIHKKNILFVNENSVEEWAKSIKKFYIDDKLLNELKADAYKTIVENYQKKYFDEKFLKLIS